MGGQVAQWVMLQSAPVNQTVSFSEGITRTYRVKDPAKWGSRTTTNVAAGFTFKFGETKIEIPSNFSKVLAAEYSPIFEQSTSTTSTFHFGPGVVWHWHFEITDGAGTTLARAHNLALTANAAEPPCCPPGFFKDITKPQG